MINLLHQLGDKLACFFGEPFHGINDKGTYDSIKKLIFDSNSLANILPYESFDEQSGVFINMTSLGFVIEFAPLVGSDNSTFKILQGVIQETLEEGSSLQCLLFADHRIDAFFNPWEKVFKQHSIFAEVAKNRTDHFKAQTEFPVRLFKVILSYSISKSNNFESDKSKLSDIKDRLLKALQTITFTIPWQPKHFLETVGGLVSFSKSSEMNKRKWDPLLTLADQLAIGSKLEVDEKYLSWKRELESEVQFKSYKIYETPDYWPLFKMQSLIGDLYRDQLQIKCPFFIHYGIHCPKQAKLENNFFRSSFLIENQGKSPSLIRLIPDLAKELKECDYVRRSLNQGARFVWTQFSTGIWSEAKKIGESEQSLKNLFRNNEFKLMATDNIHLPHYLSVLPMTWGEYVEDLKQLKLLKTTLTDECPNFMPIQGEWLGTSSPGMVFTGRRGQLLSWNQFDDKSANYNCVVVGKSGQGKSVFMQELLFTSLGKGVKVFILDVGRSYEKMCELLSGQHLQFTKGINICLNPFTNISLTDEEERSNAFSDLKSVIGCMAANEEGINSHESALIEMAIQGAWQLKKNNATITDVSNWLQLHESSTAKRLGIMLGPYTATGTYAKYFEGENSVNFSNPMVLIELEELKAKKDLQGVILQLFIMAITNNAFTGDRKTPFIICIDEGWDLLRSKQMGVFIETLARRLRKYKGSLVVGTQNIEDFFSTPGAKAAYDNSEWKCFLPLDHDAINQQIAKCNLSMDEHKLQLLKSIQTVKGVYSEILISSGSGRYAVARFFLDAFSHLLYSTNAQDYARIKELSNKGLTIVQAINEIIAARKGGYG